MKRLPKIKILYVGPIPPEAGGEAMGGVATLCWELANQAYKKGYEVYIWTNVASSFNKDGINVISVPSKNKLIKSFYFLRSYLANRKKVGHLNFLTFKQRFGVFYKAYLLKEVLKSLKADLIHVLHILDDVNFSLNALKDCPSIIVTEHGVALLSKYELHKMYRMKEKSLLLRKVEEVLKRANCVISSSQFSKLSLLNSFNLPNPEKVRAILNPINSDKISLLNREEQKKILRLSEKKIVTFCGTSLPIARKGLDILLRSFDNSNYLRSNCKILVITNNKAKIYAQEFVKARNIDGLILGPQPWEMMVKYYNAADVFVMPSRQEGIGLVYYEALLAGVPIIGFFESVNELEKVLGIYIGEKFDANKEDEKCLAKKIKTVLDKTIDRQLLRKKVIDNLSWDAKFHEFDSVYRRILAEKS